jgi:hypothetical protein
MRLTLLVRDCRGPKLKAAVGGGDRDDALLQELIELASRRERQERELARERRGRDVLDDLPPETVALVAAFSTVSWIGGYVAAFTDVLTETVPVPEDVEEDDDAIDALKDELERDMRRSMRRLARAILDRQEEIRILLDEDEEIDS